MNDRLRIPVFTRASAGAQVLGMLPGMAAYAALLWMFREFVTDDALITLRYARNWAEGHGIRWNPGEDPVEGYSNFSHVALAAAALHAGLPPLALLRALNALAGLGVVALTHALALGVLQDRRFACAAALLVGAHPAFAYWSVSGLETALYACTLLLGVYALERDAHWLACGAFLFASLTRLEGAAATLVAAAAYAGADAVRRRDALRRHAPWLGAFVLLYGAYFLWRWDYFGHPLSNSAYYKTRGDPGGTLVVAFLRHNAPLLLLLPLAPYRRLGALGVTCLALLGLYLAGYYGVHAQVAYLHRFFLPVYAPAVLLATAALSRPWRAPAAQALQARAATLVALALVLAWDLGNASTGIQRVAEQSDRMNERMVTRARVAAFVAERFAPSARVMMQDVGVVGYVLHNPILDSFGLNSEAFTQRFALRRGPYVHSLLETRPEVIVLVSRATAALHFRYATDHMIASGPAFREYRPVQVVPSVDEDYHYVIFAHGSLAERATRHASAKRRIAIDGSAELTGLLQRTARAAWALQHGRAHAG